jgi:hypothetical protein
LSNPRWLKKASRVGTITLTVRRASNDHLKSSSAGWRAENIVEEGLEFGSIATHRLQYGRSVE